MENIIFNIIICFIGLLGLFFGGEKLVTGSVSLASVFKVKPQFIAISIIALGTSFPELVVSINAVLDKSPGIAWGNVVGSNISNILLVLGLASLITPLSLKKKISSTNILWLFFSSITFFIVCIGIKKISLYNGLIFIFFLIIFLSHSAYFSKGDNKHQNKNDNKNSFSIGKSILYIFFGIILLIISAKAVVNSAVKIAYIFHVPETFVGLTIIAIGTSLPEIAASIIAVKKGHSEIAVGNVIGSNIFNIFGIIGVSAIFSAPKDFLVPKSFLSLDIPVMLISTLLFSSFVYFKFKMGRNIGIIFLLSYLIYIYLNIKFT